MYTREPGRWRQRWDGLALSTRVCIALGMFVFAFSMGTWIAEQNTEPTGRHVCEVPRNDGTGLVWRRRC
ncbi:hypothetical protein [Streptomyces sp. NPDC001388]|uniref:hypothetical protein n=1 Tax=Streptomyces sp. NPDC001388 TaxID=3364568 RepID=UPI0036C08306